MMARPGVTYHDVAKAAIEISGQGKFTTIDNIRQLLGAGSSSTIQQEPDRQMNDLRQQLQNLAQENKQIQQQYNQSQQTIRQLTNDKLALEQALIQLQKEQTALYVEAKNSDQKRNDKQNQIEELKRSNSKSKPIWIIS